ncbi:MAG: carbohydrate-binding domain-containing protein [Pseudomonadota bacterium]
MDKKMTVFTAVLVAMMILAMGCNSGSGSSSTTSDASGGDQTVADTGTGGTQDQGETDDDSSSQEEETSDVIDQETGDTQEDATGITGIALNGTRVDISGSGALADGAIITITSSGTYRITGTLSDGQIRVDAGNEADVKLVLDGAHITCSNSSPINVVKARTVTLELGDLSENIITDSDTYVYEDSEEDEPDAAIFSKADLIFQGTGTLWVNALYNDGIKSKDSLSVQNGTITVISVDDGIVGKDNVVIRGGSVTVDARGDGIKSTNDADTAKGYVSVTGGILAITSGNDAIQAETDAFISGGELTLSSGGGSNTAISGDDSAKGIKAGTGLTVSGGVITVDSSDDALHSNGTILINDGSIAIRSGDDGIHADTSIEISGSDITIDRSYEGIESAAITVSGGTLHIVSSDDGINVAGGNDGSSVLPRPGLNTFTPSGNYFLSISGGYCFVEAAGDGIDVNGSITMSGGIVLVNGPTDNANGALDYDASFSMSGGFLLAAGSRGMAQAPSPMSSQPSVMVNFSSTQPAGRLIHLETSDGKGLFTFAPTKTFQSVVFSSSELTTGSNLKIYQGGTSTGTRVDGLYQNGTYSPGTLYAQFSLNQSVTEVR